MCRRITLGFAALASVWFGMPSSATAFLRRAWWACCPLHPIPRSSSLWKDACLYCGASCLAGVTTVMMACAGLLPQRWIAPKSLCHALQRIVAQCSCRVRRIRILVPAIFVARARRVAGQIFVAAHDLAVGIGRIIKIPATGIVVRVAIVRRLCNMPVDVAAKLSQAKKEKKQPRKKGKTRKQKKKQAKQEA